MARRGRVGRLPRSQPNLSSTILSLAREMQNRRDANMMDAWQKGGTFEGAVVTDDMVLDHWRSRLKGISTKDPLYDTYKNTVMQYEYSIGESKAATDYAQGKLSDAGMANFYLGWAKKVPADSEFYRALQRDAAQFLRSAKASGAARAAKASKAAYDAAKADVNKKYGQTGDYLTSVIENMIRTRYPVGESAKTTADVFRAADPTAALEMINSMNNVYYAGTSGRGGAIEDSGSVVTGSQILYHDPITGQPVTALDVQQTLSRMDPGFTGTVTPEYYTYALRDQIDGQQRLYDLAVKANNKTDAKAALKKQGATSAIGTYAGSWQPDQAYIDLRDKFLKVWGDPSATPDQKLEAWGEYQPGLVELANSNRWQISDSMRTSLIAEATGDDSVDSLAETFVGTNDSEHDTLYGSTVKKGDIADTWADLDSIAQMKDDVSAGKAHWTMGDFNNGVFTPNPLGVSVGATSTPPGRASITIYMPQGEGLDPIPVSVEGRPITAKVIDASGATIPSTTVNSQIIGYAYDTVKDGVSERIYSYRDPKTGLTYYTPDLRVTQGAEVVENDVGLQVTVVTAADLSTPEGLQSAAASGLFRNQPMDDGTPRLSVDPGTVVIDSERAKAGPDPFTDSVSPTLALLKQDPEDVASLLNTPAFQFQMEAEARFSAGQTYDPANGWLGTPEQAAAGDSILGKMRLQAVQSIPVFDESVRNGLWDRTVVPPAPKSGGLAPDDRMPADKVKGTEFASLGNVFQPGTNLLRRKVAAEIGSTTQAITTPVEIKLPSAPNVTVTPKIRPQTGQPVSPPAAPTVPDIMNTYRPRPVNSPSGRGALIGMD